MVPNIIKEERLFTPLNDAVTARVAYDDDEIVFLLEVDDRTMSLPGDEYFTEPAMPARAALIDASGPDKELSIRADDASLQAAGEWKDGRWRVVMKRSRRDADGDVLFDDGRFIPIAFANWDGSNGAVGSKHTLTTWYWLTLPPQSDVVKTYGLPAGIGLLVFLAGFSLVRSQRRQA